MIKHLLRQMIFFFLSLLMLTVFSSPLIASAATGQVTLSSGAKNYEVGDEVKVTVKINTGGEKVGAVGFSIDFPTEQLEGEKPDNTGSVFPMTVVSSSTRYDGGTVGTDGFSGTGLIVTLVFKAKLAGAVTINLDNLMVNPSSVHMVEKIIDGKSTLVPDVTPLDGFQSNSLALGIYGVGQKPVVTEDTGETSAATPAAPEIQPEKIAPVESTLKASAEPMTTKTITSSGQSKGSKTSVNGQIGAQKEAALQPVTGTESGTGKVLIKGISLKNPLYYGLLPTLLLLALVTNLGIKLYFTEKKRHLELVHLFDNQLGALSSLESKLDIVDSKSEGGKEKIIEEFEAAKNQIMTEEKAKLPQK